MMVVTSWQHVAMFGILMAGLVVLGVTHVLPGTAIALALSGAGGYVTGWLNTSPRKPTSLPPPADGSTH